jgi:uncharacterized protein (TIGR03437 family)
MFARARTPFVYTSRMSEKPGINKPLMLQIPPIFQKMRLLSVLLISATLAAAAPPSRITRPLDASRTAPVTGHVHRLAQAQYDRGAVDPAKQLNYMVLLVKPSMAQQAELDQLLVDQQNPASANFRNWLTPEQFGSRFGLNSSDRSKMVAWLTSQGFTVDHLARSSNWIAFTGSAAQVSSALHTPIHQFQVNGETHFANTAVPSVPEAFSEIVGGFLGLDDFLPQSQAKMAKPDFNIGRSNYLAPADWTTIYDVNPLYGGGIDGTGESIAIVGQSDVLPTDISKFRSTYGLPVNNPKMMPYGTDPGFTSSQFEGNLDLEWAGAIAPKATLYYVYGQNAFTAMVYAVELNVAPVVSVSYLSCEVDISPGYYRSVAQQGNAQGITILAAAGDAGAAGCDTQGLEPFATRGRSVVFPAVLPEVTGVGGTMFAEGTGTYWGANSSTTTSSVLSYIPEAAWNENTTTGLWAGGGGTSLLYSKPVWQTGPGVPADNARHVPDVSFTSALHDGYLVTYGGSTYVAYGTSAATPSMAASLALLSHYQLLNKIQKTPGLGNINPQLYRLAQGAPLAFNDVVMGNTMVPCAQGSPDCLTGSFGYPATVGYDQATGLGSLDVNYFVNAWNSSTNGSVVTLTVSAAKATLNDSVQVTAAVTPATGNGTPTGTVNFIFDSIALGSATLAAGTATVSVPLYQIGFTGSGIPISVEYSGDAAFSPSGATKTIQITYPTGVASIVPSAPATVWPQPADAQGLSWATTIFLNEAAGVPANVTGLTIDGVAQSLSQYFPSPQISPRGSVNAKFLFRGLTGPVVKTFVFTGTDPTGLAWSRQVAVNYMPLPTYSYGNLSATPLTAVQNPANTACPWSVQLNLDDQGGYGVYLIRALTSGAVDFSSQIASIFGTTRLDAFGGLQGTLCYSNVTPPATDSIYLQLSNGAYQNISVSFAAPPANPGTLSATPATINFPTVKGSIASVNLAVNLSDKTQSWSASVYPANRTTSWLTASQLSGTGSGTITLTPNPAGFEPGVYRATVVIQSQNAVPQYINVPVMFTLGGSTGTTITAVANTASYKTSVSPGMLLGVFGTGLANSTATASGNPLAFSLAGVSATVNGLAAPVTYASPTFLIIQVPYEAGAGPAVLGINNNGQIAGFAFQMSPSSPGVFADANGNVLPTSTVKQGTALALYVTGAGDVSPAIKTAYAPSSSNNTPVPLLPLSVTVGGVPAFLEFVGITPGLIGVTQVNILVPSTVPLGNQPIVVTIGGNASAPVNVVVQ